MATPRPAPTRQDPSIWYKLKMGAMMGGGVGLTIGFIFGSWTVFRHGPGPRGVLSTLSEYMLGSAATFSFFLAIGSVIRTDELIPPHIQAARLQMMQSTQLRSKAEGFQMMRNRWQEERRRQASSPRPVLA